METIAQMKERARAQEAYGKWNVAPLWNEIARREDEMRSPLHRAARRVGTVLFLAVAYAITLAPVAMLVKNLFVAG
jgi:hypothetical protein